MGWLSTVLSAKHASLLIVVCSPERPCSLHQRDLSRPAHEWWPCVQPRPFQAFPLLGSTRHAAVASQSAALRIIAAVLPEIWPGQCVACRSAAVPGVWWGLLAFCPTTPCQRRPLPAIAAMRHQLRQALVLRKCSSRLASARTCSGQTCLTGCRSRACPGELCSCAPVPCVIPFSTALLDLSLYAARTSLQLATCNWPCSRSQARAPNTALCHSETGRRVQRWSVR